MKHEVYSHSRLASFEDCPKKFHYRYVLRVPAESLVSEPVRIGSVQIPPGGQPVVTLYDGPTVGGYAKIALVEAGDLDRLVQTRPGQQVHFELIA